MEDWYLPCPSAGELYQGQRSLRERPLKQPQLMHWSSSPQWPVDQTGKPGNTHPAPEAVRNSASMQVWTDARVASPDAVRPDTPIRTTAGPAQVYRTPRSHEGSGRTDSATDRPDAPLASSRCEWPRSQRVGQGRESECAGSGALCDHRCSQNRPQTPGERYPALLDISAALHTHASSSR